MNWLKRLFGISIPPSKVRLTKNMYRPYLNDWWNQ